MYLGIVNVNNFSYIKLRNLPLDIYFNQIPKSISIQLVYINMLLSDF